MLSRCSLLLGMKHSHLKNILENLLQTDIQRVIWSPEKTDHNQIIFQNKVFPNTALICHPACKQHE